jgi:hypothetical protein
VPSRPRTALASLALLTLACAYNPMSDGTETSLLTDPVTRFEIVVDRGTVQAVSFDRATALVKRHTFGYRKSVAERELSFIDGVVRFESHCDSDLDECTWDHLLELPFGVSFDIEMTSALLEFANIDGDIAATFDSGRFKGTGMLSPTISVTAENAAVSIEYAQAPVALTLDLAAGSAAITLPAGDYQCNLTADAGEVITDGITCDPAASAVLDIHLGDGDIEITGVAAP